LITDPVIAAQTPAEDFTIEQRWEQYTNDEHAVWDLLYDRQIKTLKGRAVPEFYAGLEALSLGGRGVPDLANINPKLKALTGWEVVMVPHLVPDLVFFEHLANRRFPAGRFLRSRSELDYLEEPDVFHDIFGHVPLLTQPVFADYMQAYGQGGLRAERRGMLKQLARLYWYTVEFGLMDTAEGLRIYGAGIVSSLGESLFSLDDPSPNRIGFDLERIMRTDYRIDDYQQSYFVIQSYRDLFKATQQDFAPIYARLDDDMPPHSPETILKDDKILTHGTQAYVKARLGEAK
jgi:phenylalanine-4-hydroxylase